MTYLYLTEQRSVLRKRGHRLVYEKDEATLLDIPCHQVESVLVFGNVQITTQALQEMLENGIEMALFSRTGKLLGQLTAPATKNIFLRLAQFRRHDDPVFRLELARIVLTAKVANGLKLVGNFAANHPEADLGPELRELKAALQGLARAGSLEVLRGLEGTAARHYFGMFGKLLRGQFDFPGRRRRPPPDPVNALLSLGYTLVGNEIAALLDGLGFDPYLGFLHENRYGRASLANDLVEEFRAPVADRLTLNLINNRVLAAGDFYPNPATGGVQLTREALKRFVAAYEVLMTQELTEPGGERISPRRALRRQAERLAKTLDGGAAYVPFCWG